MTAGGVLSRRSPCWSQAEISHARINGAEKVEPVRREAAASALSANDPFRGGCFVF